MIGKIFTFILGFIVGTFFGTAILLWAFNSLFGGLI